MSPNQRTSSAIPLPGALNEPHESLDCLKLSTARDWSIDSFVAAPELPNRQDPREYGDHGRPNTTRRRGCRCWATG